MFPSRGKNKSHPLLFQTDSVEREKNSKPQENFDQILPVPRTAYCMYQVLVRKASWCKLHGFSFIHVLHEFVLASSVLCTIYSRLQIKRNDGSIQANCATKEILITKWVISIPISIMFIDFTILTFYSSKKPLKLRILANFLK